MTNKVDPTFIQNILAARYRVNERPALGETVAPIEAPSITEFVVKELVSDA